MRSIKSLVLVSLLVTQPWGRMASGDENSFSVEELNEESTYVVLCARAGGDEWLDVARRLAAVRDARAIIRFNASRPGELLPVLTEFAPENVAYVVSPELITPELAGQMAELSSRIDPDKRIDFASGYVTGVTADDAMKLIERMLVREAVDEPIPRVCTGIGHSWYKETSLDNAFFVMKSRERGRGPTLRLTNQDGEFSVVRAAADVCLSQRNPDNSFQVRGLNYRLTLSPAYGSTVLVHFDLDEGQRADPNVRAILEIPVDQSRWKFGGEMVVGVSPIETAWDEDSATWNDAPEFNRVTTIRAPADETTTTLVVDVTALLKQMRYGVALFCHSDGEHAETKKPLRHMYHYLERHVGECKQLGFAGTTIEALWGDEWKAKHLDWLQPISEGGLILFGGHGSASSSCLVNIDDIAKLEIGPSVVVNGTCYGATTHQIMKYGDHSVAHRQLGTIDPSESFALQLLREGTLGVIGGSTTCAFAYVEPAIRLLRDEHMSLGETMKSIQNGFIERVPIDQWDAGGMEPGDPGFAKVDGKHGTHPTIIQYSIRTICLGDPAFVPFPRRNESE